MTETPTQGDSALVRPTNGMGLRAKLAMAAGWILLLLVIVFPFPWW
jgi:hypothetical protein